MTATEIRRMNVIGWLFLWFSIVVVAVAFATSSGCSIRDDFAGTDRKVTSYSVYREGHYDEGGPIVLRFYREGETGGPVGVQREAIR